METSDRRRVGLNSTTDLKIVSLEENRMAVTQERIKQVMADPSVSNETELREITLQLSKQGAELMVTGNAKDALEAARLLSDAGQLGRLFAKAAKNTAEEARKSVTTEIADYIGEQVVDYFMGVKDANGEGRPGGKLTFPVEIVISLGEQFGPQGKVNVRSLDLVSERKTRVSADKRVNSGTLKVNGREIGHYKNKREACISQNWPIYATAERGGKKTEKGGQIMMNAALVISKHGGEWIPDQA
jgi:hypothetical protein